MNQSVRDPFLPSWFWTSPRIEFTVPDWLVINGGKSVQANDGTVERRINTELKNAPRPVIVYKDGDFHHFASVSQATRFLGIAQSGRMLLSLRTKVPILRHDGSALWAADGSAPERMREGFELWKRSKEGRSNDTKI